MLTAGIAGLLVTAVLLWPLAGPDVGRSRGRDRRGAPHRGIGPRRQGVPRREVVAVDESLVELVSLLSGPLRAGVAPSVALAAAAPAFGRHPLLGPVLADLVAASAEGHGLAETWLRHGARVDSPGLAFVGRAWALTERTGAPLADALVVAESALRSKIRARRQLEAASAGPRASMTVLCLLPCAGPLVGLAFGLGPGELYGANPVSTASLALGVALALLGWWWSRRILAAALPGSTRGGHAAQAGPDGRPGGGRGR